MKFLFHFNVPVVSSQDFTRRDNPKGILNESTERSESAVLIPEKSPSVTANEKKCDSRLRC